MIANPQLVRKALLEFLTPILADTRYAEPTTTNALRMLALEFGGQVFPRIKDLDALEDEARAAELLPKGASVAVERLGVHRSTIYRRARRYHSRKAA